MNEYLDFIRMAGFSFLFALIVIVAVYCLFESMIRPSKPAYFGAGSHREMLLIIAIRNYMSTLAPSLACDCEFILENEQATQNKCRFNVTIRFKHDSICHCDDEKAIYLVDVSDSTEVQIVKPVNDKEIMKYKI